MFRWTCVVGILAVGATILIGDLLERRHVYRVPEAAVGLAVGGGLAAMAMLVHNTEMMVDERFNDEFFMVWLLPPIIFAAGFNMNVPAFFANILPTVLLAFGGTLLSAFFVGGAIYAAGQVGLCYPLSKLAALFFGSLISATDPVTVLAVFKAIGVRDDIFAIVFGESVLNDAVAIVLARTVLAFAGPEAAEGGDTATAIVLAVVIFVIIFLGSMAIGVLAGMLCALTFKHMRLYEHDEKQVVEASVAFVFPWAAYYAAEALELSGIVAILFCGIVMATYARPNLSDAAVVLTRDLFEALAKGAETFVFVYLGMAVLTFPIFSHTVWLLAACTMVACLFGRLHVFVGAAITNAIRRGTREKGRAGAARTISVKHATAIWFSGLRGGVAFAIAAASFGDSDFGTRCGGWVRDAGDAGDAEAHAPSHCPEGSTDSLAILQATLLIAVFTIVAFGSPSRDVAVVCKVLQPKRSSTSQHGAGGIQGASSAPKYGWWRALDARLTPFLTVRSVHAADGAPPVASNESSLRAAVGLAAHKPAPHSLLQGQDDGGWNTESVVPDQPPSPRSADQPPQSEESVEDAAERSRMPLAPSKDAQMRRGSLPNDETFPL